jgi:hypothetical protein
MLKNKQSNPITKTSKLVAYYLFIGNPLVYMPNGLPFRLTDYLKLVDWTGRILRDNKHGSIPEKVPPILVQLNLDPKHWFYLSQH